jgi:hypothetical protein
MLIIPTRFIVVCLHVSLYGAKMINCLLLTGQLLGTILPDQDFNGTPNNTPTTFKERQDPEPRGETLSSGVSADQAAEVGDGRAESLFL